MFCYGKTTMYLSMSLQKSIQLFVINRQFFINTLAYDFTKVKRHITNE